MQDSAFGEAVDFVPASAGSPRVPCEPVSVCNRTGHAYQVD